MKRVIPKRRDESRETEVCRDVQISRQISGIGKRSKRERQLLGVTGFVGLQG